MIAIDTSALMAIVQNEPQAAACIRKLADERDVLISAGTVAEVLIVAARRNHGPAMEDVLNGPGIEIVPVTASTAQRMSQCYSKWGKGVHPAALNLGDCFAYDVAEEYNCPLLFIGDDFSKTDILSAL